MNRFSPRIAHNLLALSVALCACGDDDLGGVDAGGTDAAMLDVRGLDAPELDAPQLDSTVPPGEFVPWSASDVAELEAVAPNAVLNAPIDTSGWAEYDATMVGGTDPEGPADFQACGNMDPTGSQMNNEAFRCLWRGMGEEACLVLPAGLYNFGDQEGDLAVLRPSFETDHRCLRGAGMGENQTGEGGSIIQLTTDHTQPTAFIDFEEDDENWLAPPVAWNGGNGGMRGATELTGIDSTGMSEGEWLYLSARSNALQHKEFDGSPGLQEYHARIVSIAGETITIDRTLPTDFDGGSAEVRRWNPAEQVVFEDLVVRYENPEHQRLDLNWHMAFRHSADCQVHRVRFVDSYQRAVTTGSWNARLRIAHSVFEMQHWDKPTNGYMVTLEGADISIVDNYIADSPQAFGCVGGHGMLFAFNHIAAPRDNQPAFDRRCIEGDNENSCRQVEQDHAPDPETGSRYHCSSREPDLAGTNGDASCRGTRADVVSGSILLHNRSCNSATFARNSFDAQPWIDFTSGPGRHNFFFGNRFVSGAAVNADGATGRPGDFAVKTGECPGEYRNDMMLMNNNLQNLGAGAGFDYCGDGVQIHYNVIRGQCFYNNESGENATGGACVEGGEAGRGGVRTTWENNDVGQDDRSNEARMPSAPGFDRDPRYGGSTPFPYVGADMGPSGGSGCLPSYERYHGSCD